MRRRAGDAVRRITPHLVHQASRVAELVEAGHSQNQIGQMLGVSGPRIAEIKRRLPELREYLGQPEPLDRLRSRREQLWRLRHQTLDLAATIRRDLRELDQELEAATVDQVLGLRQTT